MTVYFLNSWRMFTHYLFLEKKYDSKKTKNEGSERNHQNMAGR